MNTSVPPYTGQAWHTLNQEVPLRVELTEVGLRDGLQNENVLVSTELKLVLLEGLVNAGLRRLQVTSFVHPQWVPQMADAEAVCKRLPQKPGVVYSGLVLNRKGVERARAAGLTHVDMSVSASDTHSRRNTNRSRADALEAFSEMVQLAHESGMMIRGGVQSAFGCAHEGAIPEADVIAMVERYLALGVEEISLSDTAGLARPSQIRAMLLQINRLVGDIPVVLHLHDTRGLGLVNVLAALECGVTRFDTSFGGMGGCPFIKGATGNIATEDTLHLLHSLGIETGINPAKVAACSLLMEQHLGKTLPGKLYRLHREEEDEH